MRFKHTNRPGFLLGFIDFFTAGIFFLLYMPFGGLQEELEEVLGHRVMPYWKAYLLGVPTLFIYTLVWMARIAEELKRFGRDNSRISFFVPERGCPSIKKCFSLDFLVNVKYNYELVTGN